MNKPAAIYARVSSDRQKESHTIASQTAAMIEYAQRLAKGDVAEQVRFVNVTFGLAAQSASLAARSRRYSAAPIGAARISTAGVGRTAR